MTHVTCRLTANNRDQLQYLRSVIEYGLPLAGVVVAVQYKMHTYVGKQIG